MRLSVAVSVIVAAIGFDVCISWDSSFWSKRGGSHQHRSSLYMVRFWCTFYHLLDHDMLLYIGNVFIAALNRCGHAFYWQNHDQVRFILGRPTGPSRDALLRCFARASWITSEFEFGYTYVPASVPLFPSFILNRPFKDWKVLELLLQIWCFFRSFKFFQLNQYSSQDTLHGENFQYCMYFVKYFWITIQPSSETDFQSRLISFFLLQKSQYFNALNAAPRLRW